MGEQRRKSRQLIKSQVGTKQHFSDEDVQEDKPQRSALSKRNNKDKLKKKGSDDFEFEKQMKAAQLTNNKKRGSFQADIIVDMDDQKLLNFHEDIYQLNDGNSSDSEHAQYEHVRLKSVHERKSTPHNLSTPNGDE